MIRISEDMTTGCNKNLRNEIHTGITVISQLLSCFKDIERLLKELQSDSLF